MQTKLVLKQRSALKLRFQPGATGPAGQIVSVDATTLPPGSPATVVNNGTPQAAELVFGIPEGNQGIQGLTGDNGWTPELAVATDGARRVQQVVDWFGGEGTKPATGDYVGATGLTPTIGDAVNIRGSDGTATIPDGDKGDVTTSAGGDTWLLNAGAVKDTHVASDAAIAATKLAFTPAAGVAATDVQGAIEELAGDIVASRAVSQPEGRLSLTSGDPTPVSDVAGATTIYYVPAVGIRVPVYDGSNFIAREFTSQLSLALDATSGHTQYHASGANFDLFGYWTGSALALGTGPSWASGAVAGSATARGTGAGSTELEVYLGRVVNKNSIQLRVGSSSGDLVNVDAREATYLGSFRAVAAGQASDTKTARLLFNAYNQIVRKFYVTDGTTSHTYSTASFALYNSSSSNRVAVLCGLSGVIADMMAAATFTTSTTTYRNAYVAIGLDSTSSPASENVGTAQAAQVNQASSPLAFWKGSPGLGYHEINWLYSGAGTDTQTWLGTSSSFRIGMTGTVTL